MSISTTRWRYGRGVNAVRAMAVLLAIGVVEAAGTGCTGGDLVPAEAGSAGGSGTGAAPGPGTGDGNRGSQPGTGAPWDRVSRTVECTPAGNEPLCVNGSFEVRPDGSFRFVESAREGRIAAAELAELDTAARAIALADLAQALQCRSGGVGIPEIGAESVSVALSGGEPVIVFRRSAQEGSCFRGGEPEVDRLRSQLAALTSRYADPTGAPGTTGYDPCGGKSCGDSCTLCPPDQPGCVETQVLKFCSASGKCGPEAPSCGG